MHDKHTNTEPNTIEMNELKKNFQQNKEWKVEPNE